MDGHCNASSNTPSIEDCLRAGAKRISYLEETIEELEKCLANKKTELDIALQEKKSEKDRTDRILKDSLTNLVYLLRFRKTPPTETLLLNSICPFRCINCGNIGTIRNMYTKPIHMKIGLQELSSQIICRYCASAEERVGRKIFALCHSINEKVNVLTTGAQVA